MKKKYPINLPALFTTLLSLAVMTVIGFHRLTFDADVVASMPQNDPVLKDARYIIRNHPAQDFIVIDIAAEKADPDRLVAAAAFIEKELTRSRLFSIVGTGHLQHLVPELLEHVAVNLPLLFTQKELVEDVAPLLQSACVREKMAANYLKLQAIDGIGHSRLIAMDPLGLSHLVMARLQHLSPANNAVFYRGHLMSKDRRHLLITVQPKGAGTDTEFARRVTRLMGAISEKLNKRPAGKETAISLTPMGAYRYALDNEVIARADTRRAILLATVGIALLLILIFPRPLIGLFAFIPAVAGTVSAFFIFSLLYRSISILALGFGGAIISITIDHGIAYLLFLDREKETSGKIASKEVWSVGLLATLTTAGAFSVLIFSGFPILAQVGLFAAMGILSSFLFVHTIFPIIFPHMPPARRGRPRLIQNSIDKLALSVKSGKLVTAVAFALTMAFFAKPVFHVDLSSINTVRAQTLEAEKKIKQYWGNIFDRIYMITEADTIEDLTAIGDHTAELFTRDLSGGVLKTAFTPSLIFPGKMLAQNNFSAWKKFWDKNRKTELSTVIRETAKEIGFTPDAFDVFLARLNPGNFSETAIPEKFYPLLGISPLRQKGTPPHRWIQFTTLLPGASYDAKRFVKRYAQYGHVKIFDPKYFTAKLGDVLSSTFLKMIIIIGISLVIFLLIFFMDIKLTLTALAPIVFALTATLGTLKIIGHPLDIPGLMLSIVVLGMGIDYSLYFVRSHQRYLDERHAHLGLIRTAVFLASLSTMIGFGVMCFADHSLLSSAGLTSLLGIVFSLTGAFFILPVILKAIFDDDAGWDKKPTTTAPVSPAPVLRRFRHLETFPRLFARFKIKFDPMVMELNDFLTSPKVIMDLGCGYGVPAAWLLTCFPDARVFGIDPDPEKVRIASRVVAERGKVVMGRAPKLPEVPQPADTVLMLDLLNYMGDRELILTLDSIYRTMLKGGILLIRITIPRLKRFPWLRWIETTKLTLNRIKCRYRSLEAIESMISNAGFINLTIKKSGSRREEMWFRAEK
jgi:predicted exporter/SAM-dependent methyltransferase